jgi:hypothetical protein
MQESAHVRHNHRAQAHDNTDTKLPRHSQMRGVCSCAICCVWMAGYNHEGTWRERYRGHEMASLTAASRRGHEGQQAWSLAHPDTAASQESPLRTWRSSSPLQALQHMAVCWLVQRHDEQQL